MTDHAGDMAQRIADLLHASPGNRTSVGCAERSRESARLVVTQNDGSVFRITIEATGWDGLTEDELELDSVPIWLEWHVSRSPDPPPEVVEPEAKPLNVLCHGCGAILTVKQ